MLSGVLCSKSVQSSDRGFGGSHRQSAYLLKKAIDQWRPRLKTVVKVHGGHIEQLFT